LSHTLVVIKTKFRYFSHPHSAVAFENYQHTFSSSACKSIPECVFVMVLFTTLLLFACVEYTEEEVEVKPKSTFMDQFLSSTSPKKSSKPAVVSQSSKTEHKPSVSASDFFGGGSIHRVERKVAPVRKVGIQAHTTRFSLLQELFL